MLLQVLAFVLLHWSLEFLEQRSQGRRKFLAPPTSLMAPWGAQGGSPNFMMHTKEDKFSTQIATFLFHRLCHDANDKWNSFLPTQPSPPKFEILPPALFRKLKGLAVARESCELFENQVDDILAENMTMTIKRGRKTSPSCSKSYLSLKGVRPITTYVDIMRWVGGPKNVHLCPCSRWKCPISWGR